MATETSAGPRATERSSGTLCVSVGYEVTRGRVGRLCVGLNPRPGPPTPHFGGRRWTRLRVDEDSVVVSFGVVTLFRSSESLRGFAPSSFCHSLICVGCSGNQRPYHFTCLVDSGGSPRTRGPVVRPSPSVSAPNARAVSVV